MITVLPGFNAFSICKVYLELSSLGCFLNGNSNSNCSTNHWVVTHSDKSLSLIHISEPTRLGMISYAVFCLKKKKTKTHKKKKSHRQSNKALKQVDVM